MAQLAYADVYPRTVMLGDGATITLRPLEATDKISLLDFFKRIPEDERYYLKENVTSPETIRSWTSNIDLERVIPIVAVAGDDIVADATLHRSRSQSRRHIGEIRVVVDPAYREVGLGRRLIRELLDIAADLGLDVAAFELVAGREAPAIRAAESVGFREKAHLKDWVKDHWGNYQDLTVMELPLGQRHLWWY